LNVTFFFAVPSMLDVTVSCSFAENGSLNTTFREQTGVSSPAISSAASQLSSPSSFSSSCQKLQVELSQSKPLLTLSVEFSFWRDRLDELYESGISARKFKSALTNIERSGAKQHQD
jgi:hypothetical protein